LFLEEEKLKDEIEKIRAATAIPEDVENSSNEADDSTKEEL